MASDITLIKLVRALKGPRGRLYYFQGNFYYPLDLHGSEVGRVKRAIRQFKKDNADLVRSDQACPEYKNKLEIFDSQY